MNDDIDKVLKYFMTTTQRQYIINFENNNIEPIKLFIDENINRPNNPDYDEMIKEYIEYNYGNVMYEAIRIDDIKSDRIE